MTTPRAREVIAYIREHGLNVHACFGPLRRGSVRPFIGGGVVSQSDYLLILDELASPPVVVDAAAEARFRAMRAADKWRR